MQLSQIREAIEFELDHAPNSARWRKKLNEKISRAQQMICAEREWRFMRKKFTYIVGPDILFGQGSGQFSNVTLTYNGTNVVTASAGLDVYTNQLVGQTFISPTGFEQQVSSISGTQIFLSSPIAEAAGAGKAGSIRSKGWPLPDDIDVLLTCYEKLRSAVTFDKDGVRTGQLNAWTRKRGDGELHEIDLLDDASGPLDYTEIGEPQAIRLVEENRGDYIGRIAEQHELVAAVGAGGTLSHGSTYRYVYTMSTVFGANFPGIESAPSNIASVTIGKSGANRQVALTNMRTGPTGRLLRIYRSKDDGPFYLIKMQASDVGTYTDTGDAALIDTGIPEPYFRLDFGKPNHYYRMELYPRPDAWRFLNLHYRRRLLPLAHDYDQVAIPEPYRQILVHAVVKDLATEPTTISKAKMEYDKIFARMEQNLIVKKRQREQRRRWGEAGPSSRRHRYGWRFGTPTMEP